MIGEKFERHRWLLFLVIVVELITFSKREKRDHLSWMA